MPWAVAGAAVAGIAGGVLQSGAVSGAQDSANAASAAAREQARTDLEPWRTQGGAALGVTGDLSGANGPDAAQAAMGNFYTSPGYDFRLSEGLRAVDAGASARGILRSGATLKAETKYGQGLASEEFSNYYNRLYNLSNQGLQAAGGSADASMQAGRDIAQTDVAAGGAQASIYGNTTAGLSNAANNYANNSLYRDIWGSGGGGLPNDGFLGRKY